MRNLLYFFCGLICANSFSQELIIESGGIYLDKNSVLSLCNMSIENNSEFSALDSSTLSFNISQPDIVLAGSDQTLIHNLSVNGNLTLEQELLIKGDITIKNGNLDISDYNLIIEGNIIGETEKARIFTKGTGEIVKNTTLLSGEQINPGNIGLGIKVLGKNSIVEIKRGHTINYNKNNESINRYYSLSRLNEPFELVFHYFDAELNNLDEESLSIWGEKSGQWDNLISSNINIDENFHDVEINNSYSKFSLFEDYKNEVIIPTGFSPNGDGVNDYFEIKGVENYPNNKLIILNSWGDIVFEKDNYNNDWGGISESGIIQNNNNLLLNGTYFYFFYKDKNNKKDLEKGFFEIKGSSN